MPHRDLNRVLGIGIVAYSPLGQGFFGGKAITERKLACGKSGVLGNEEAITPQTQTSQGSHPRFSGENLEKNKALYTRLANLAAKHGCTPPQLALAWLMHQGDDLVPIPGTTKIKNLNGNIQSLSVKLTPEDVREIADAIPISEVCGDREHEMMFKYEYRVANTPLKQ